MRGFTIEEVIVLGGDVTVEAGGLFDDDAHLIEGVAGRIGHVVV